MTTRSFFLALALAAAPAAAQQTLLDSGRFVGGFGGPVVKFSTVGDDYATLAGGRGGALFAIGGGHAVSIGGGGYGLADNGDWGWSFRNGERPRTLQMGYGGFEVEVARRADDLVHVSVQALVGGGGVQLVDLNDLFTRVPDVQDAFFVVEPGSNLVLNVTRWFRIGGGASYRLVRGADLGDVTDRTLSAFAGSLTFKFGAF